MTQRKTTGTIFNIQKFSIHDGVGIRTLVFMKGCPLRCLWCSNPESQLKEMEIMDVKTNCIGCGKCVKACEKKAIDGKTFDIRRENCTKCGACADVCFANAKKRVGREMTVREIMEIIEKDRVFYNNSGGGVTVGGGEPTMQAQFVESLLKKCKEQNLHTAIETCGFAPWETIRKLLVYTDQVFYDLKGMDSGTHKKQTGLDNSLILENAEKAARLGKEMVFRIPLIPHCNDDPENIMKTGRFIRGLYPFNPGISVELLSYHDLGRDKYRWLDRQYRLSRDMARLPNTSAECKKILEELGLKVL